MVSTRRLDLEALHRELRRSLRYGTRASRLIRYCPLLIELVRPAQDYPDSGIAERAITTEQLIREAIASIGGPEAEVLLILFCLKPGTTGMNLETRRQHAAELLGILPDTLRRERHEGRMLWDLAVEIYGKVR